MIAGLSISWTLARRSWTGLQLALASHPAIPWIHWHFTGGDSLIFQYLSMIQYIKKGQSGQSYFFWVTWHSLKHWKLISHIQTSKDFGMWMQWPFFKLRGGIPWHLMPNIGSASTFAEQDKKLWSQRLRKPLRQSLDMSSSMIAKGWKASNEIQNTSH